MLGMIYNIVMDMCATWKMVQSKGLFINDVSFFIDLHSIEYTLFYSVQVYKKADVIYERPLRQRLNVLDDDEAFFKRKMFHKNN